MRHIDKRSRTTRNRKQEHESREHKAAGTHLGPREGIDDARRREVDWKTDGQTPPAGH